MAGFGCDPTTMVNTIAADPANLTGTGDEEGDLVAVVGGDFLVDHKRLNALPMSFQAKRIESIPVLAVTQGGG